jgi:hypothetical protein
MKTNFMETNNPPVNNVETPNLASPLYEQNPNLGVKLEKFHVGSFQQTLNREQGGEGGGCVRRMEGP